MREHHLLFLHETDAHHTILAAFISQAHIKGPQIHDARVAALCIEHRIHTLLTFDRDFSRFTALRTASPAHFLAAKQNSASKPATTSSRSLDLISYGISMYQQARTQEPRSMKPPEDDDIPL